MISLELSYKGNRNYLHGTDIFNAVHGYLPGDAFIKCIAFRRLASWQLGLARECPDNEAALVGDVVIRLDNGEEVHWYLVETSEDITNRHSFDEDALVQESTIDGNEIYKERNARYSLIEEVVALNKALCNHIAPLRNAKWLFGQLDLFGPWSDDVARVCLRQKALLGKSLVVCDLYLDGVAVGSIRFVKGET